MKRSYGYFTPIEDFTYSGYTFKANIKYKITCLYKPEVKLDPDNPHSYDKNGIGKVRYKLEEVCYGFRTDGGLRFIPANLCYYFYE